VCLIFPWNFGGVQTPKTPPSYGLGMWQCRSCKCDGLTIPVNCFILPFLFYGSCKYMPSYAQLSCLHCQTLAAYLTFFRQIKKRWWWAGCKIWRVRVARVQGTLLWSNQKFSMGLGRGAASAEIETTKASMGRVWGRGVVIPTGWGVWGKGNARSPNFSQIILFLKWLTLWNVSGLIDLLVNGKSG